MVWIFYFKFCSIGACRIFLSFGGGGRDIIDKSIQVYLTSINFNMTLFLSRPLHVFFIRNLFFEEPHVEGQIVLGTYLLKTKSLRNFSISNIVITAINRALGSRFHSLQSIGLCVNHVTNVS